MSIAKEIIRDAASPVRLETPPRINVAYQGHTDRSREIEHAALCSDMPMVPRGAAKGRPLAIVGGGAPIPLGELQEWKGDIWAVNNTHDWLLEHGIESTFFACDSCVEIAAMATKAKKAVVASICHPEVFKALKGRRVNIFHVDGVVNRAPFQAWGHCTGLSRAHQVGIYMGYGSQHYFGASGSYASLNAAQSHVYYKPKNELAEDQIILKANRQYFKSNLVLQGQSVFLAQLFASNVRYFFEKSGGMLRAIIADPNWEIVKYSDDIKAQFVYPARAVA